MFRCSRARAVVNNMFLGPALESFGDMKVLGYFGIDGWIFHTPGSPRHAGGPGDRNASGERCDIPATGDQSCGDVGGNRLPRAVLPGVFVPGRACMLVMRFQCNFATTARTPTIVTA